MRILALILVWIGSLGAHAQIVETVLVNPKIVDGLYVDPDGNVYTTPGGLVGGVEIGKVSPGGTYSIFATGFRGPIDIESDDHGNFYVTNYDNNTLVQYNSIKDTIKTVARNLDGPAGIARAKNGDLYISNFGAVPTYDGKVIHRIPAKGEIEEFLRLDSFFRPQGITFDDKGTLYLSDSKGSIYEIDTETASWREIANLGVNLGNLEYGRGKLYATANRAHAIFEIELDGSFRKFAGSSMGSQDGELAEATFNRPLGIAFTSTEDTLYIAESVGRLRRIIFSNTVSNEEDMGFQRVRVFPNPNQGSFTLDLGSHFQKLRSIRLIGREGRMIREVQSGLGERYIILRDLPKGTYFLEAIFSGETIAKSLISL